MMRVCRVSKRFGRVAAVEGVSFEAPPNSRIAVVGPSGSGKTSLLRLIAGLETPDEGEIHLNGDLASRPGWVLPPHRRGIGFVFQTPALWPHLTVAQNAAFGLGGLPKGQARRRLGDVLAQTGLERLAGRYPHQLSGGQARRAALARTLAPRPRCLLMDEPLTNLDPEARDELLRLILDTAADIGATLIYVTHDSHEAGRVSARPWRMDAGRLEPGQGLPLTSEEHPAPSLSLAGRGAGAERDG